MKRKTLKEKKSLSDKKPEVMKVEVLEHFAEIRAALSPYWAARAGYQTKPMDQAA